MKGGERKSVERLGVRSMSCAECAVTYAYVNTIWIVHLEMREGEIVKAMPCCGFECARKQRAKALEKFPSDRFFAVDAEHKPVHPGLLNDAT